jgi:hypothetical protein
VPHLITRRLGFTMLPGACSFPLHFLARKMLEFVQILARKAWRKLTA